MGTPEPSLEREKEAVRIHWSKLNAQWKAIGPELFLRLFQAYPSVKTFFKTFDGMDMDEIRQSPKLKAHAVNFKLGITSLVENLDDVDCLVVLIQKLVANHYRRQVMTQEFQDVFKFFIVFIQEVGEIDEFTVKAWRTILDVVEGVVDEHVKTLQKEKSC